ncbi:beta clamp domain-containing protein [Cohnella cholangitidis]|uniref:Uncharacterized protein n=1 Tax=Cohnella cholangitidis TaxID=2598458 RepID=A0A7G5C5G7_9BACL|nr:hypothetical protein [Cohnella cholangitidis]QMV44451.1 hypothetical protein FPL14_27250 [Cohnella cholangitidis]
MNKQQIIAKYAKLFATKEGGGTPILEGIHYGADGTAVVTDRHRLLRIRGAHSFPQPVTMHAKRGTPIEGTYPDTTKIVPTTFESEVTLGRGTEMETALKSAKTIAAAANTIDKKIPVAKLFGQNGTAHLYIKSDSFDFKAFFGNTPNLKPIDMRSFNANYFVTALEVFADAGIDVTIKLHKPLHPIVLSGGDIDVLILPYRVN